jgi:hypothetical protein
MEPLEAQRWRSGHRFEIGLVLLYLLVVVGMIPFHEPWRDEAQVWLIARDNDLLGLLRRMKFEGSPPLWHLLLVPLVRLELPYWSMQLLHAGIAALAVALFVFASPFNRWQKAAFAFSYLMIFEYAVVARSYALSVLFVFVVAILHPRRGERPFAYVLGLLGLACSNLHGLVLAGVMAAVQVWALVRERGDSRAGWIALVLLGTGAAAATWTTIPLALHVGLKVEPVGFADSLEVVRDGMAPWGSGFGPRVLALVSVAALAWSVRGAPTALVLLVAPIAIYAFSPMAQFTTAPRHAGFIVRAVLFVLWTERGKTQREAATTHVGWSRAQGGLACMLVFANLVATIPNAIDALVGDFRGRYSASRSMAAYIDAEAIEAPIAAWRAAPASSLLPYLPERRFWYVDGREWATYVRWLPRYRRRELSERRIIAIVKRRFGEDLPWLLLSRPLTSPASYGYALQHAEKDLGSTSRGQEVFFLYRPTIDRGNEAVRR